MDNQLDQKALALAKAIRRTETGGHKDPYNARGASGEFGAFQFMPATYKNLAKKHLGNENVPPTVENQNKIVYSEIKALKDQGYNPAQIASIWNSGKPDRYKNGGVGVNKYGVAYNVPQYVAKVSNEYRKLSGGQTQQPVQQVEQAPTVTQQKQELAQQGQPVSVRSDRVQPTFGGQIVRSVAGFGAKLGTSAVNLAQAITGQEETQPFSGKYLGDVQRIGAGFDVMKGYTDPNNIKAVKDAVGTGLEAASYIPVARGVSALGSAVKLPFKQTVIQGGKALGKEGMVQGGLTGAGVALQENKNLGGVIGNTLLGAGIGGATGAVLGAGGTAISRGVSRATGRVPKEYISSQVDDEIRKAMSGITADGNKLNEMSTGVKRGLERLANESDNIMIPDDKSPIGSSVTKIFDSEKATGNEWLSAILKQRDNIYELGRQAAENASKEGRKIDTTPAVNLVLDAIETRRIGKSAGNDILIQLKNVDGDPLKLHQWIQDQVNIRHFTRSGDLSSSRIATIANDAAEIMRKNLNETVDRVGYAQAYGDNRELQRLMVSIAKKANKGIDFGDITSEAGLDAGISLLTGNPAYMARTLASGIFKGFLNRYKNQAGIKAIRGAMKNIKKIPNETKLPSSGVKPLITPAPKAKLQLPEPKTTEPTVPTQKKNLASDLSTEAKKYKSAEDINIYKDSILQSPTLSTKEITTIKNAKSFDEIWNIVKTKGPDTQGMFLTRIESKVKNLDSKSVTPVTKSDFVNKTNGQFNSIREVGGYKVRARMYDNNPWQIVDDTAKLGDGSDFRKLPSTKEFRTKEDLWKYIKDNPKSQLTDIWNKANKKQSGIFPDFPNKNAGFVATGSKIRQGADIGSEEVTDMVARERFDIPNLEKISFGGSDRDVYDLGNGKVLKVSKTSRGLDQNVSSADYYAEDNGLIPKTFEVGKNYIVKEKVLPPDINTKKMLNELKQLDVTYLVGKTGGYDNHYAEVNKAIKIFDKYGYSGEDLRNYEPLWGDITAIRNWGTTKDGKPILLDEGTLNGDLVLKSSNTRGSGISSDPEFRAIYNQSRQAKKKFGDTDKKTMYSLANPLIIGTGGTGGIALGSAYLGSKKKK
jgi:hypothetical protein